MAALVAQRTGAAQPRADAFSTDTDVLHYDLDIEINLAGAWIGGSNTMTIQSQVDGLMLFRFRLDTTFTITDVQVGGVPVNWVRVEYPAVEVTLEDGGLSVRPAPAPDYRLEKLLSQVTAANRHGEEDFGPAAGGEAW